MKTILSILSGLALASGVGTAAIAPANANLNNSAFATSITVTLPSVSTGSLLIAVAFMSTSGGYTGFTLSDTANGAWSAGNASAITTVGSRRAQMWFLPNSAASAGTLTLTATPTGATGSVGMGLGIWSFTGAASAPLDGSIPANNSIATSSTSFPAPSVTASNANEMVFSWVFNSASSSGWSISSPFTLDAFTGSASVSGGYSITSAAGALQPTLTAATAGTGVTGSAVFKAAAVSASPTAPAVVF